MNKLNKNDIINLVAEKVYLSKADAKAAVDATFDLIMDALTKGESVNIKNFCVLEPKRKLERVGTHPKTHDRIKIQSKSTVAIHLAKEFKSKINK